MATGWQYAGILAVSKDGIPLVRPQTGADALRAMLLAGPEFAAFLGPMMQRRQQSISYCQRLYALPDSRSH
jgi:hypothetical protein